MAHLKATSTLTDQARAVRLQLAWIEGDKYALDLVLDEVMADPVGTPGVLFSLLAFTTKLGEQAAPDYTDRLRARLLELDQDHA